MKIPFPFAGPDEKRFYSQDFHRWTICLSDKNDASVVARLVTNSGFGKPQLLSVALFPFIGVFVSIFFAQFTESLIWCFSSFLIAGLIPGAVIGSLIYAENKICRTSQPTEVFVYRNGGKISICDSTIDFPADYTAFFLYRLYEPPNEWSGSESLSSWSELDLVVQDQDDLAQFPLIAHTDDGCLRHAKVLSQITGLSLRREVITDNHVVHHSTA